MRINLFTKVDFIALDAWITKDGYSSSSFISAILIQVKYVVEYWDFIVTWMVFHLTTLCKCYCTVTVELDTELFLCYHPQLLSLHFTSHYIFNTFYYLLYSQSHFSVIKINHHMSNAMVPSEIAVLLKFKCEICIKKADRCTLVSNESLDFSVRFC